MLNETQENNTAIRQGVNLTRENLPYQIIERLSEVYAATHNNETAESFKVEHFAPMIEDSAISGAELETEYYKQYSPTAENLKLIPLLRLSCAYCADAIKAAKHGHFDSSWCYISFAQYWLGVSVGVSQIMDYGELALSLRAKKGADARSAKYEPLRQLARNLAFDGKYPSKRNAAKNIAPKVFAFAQKESIPFMESNAEIQVERWLGGITFGRKGTT